MLPCFLSHRGTQKEKCGGWQLTLSCPSVQQWVMIKRFGSGNYPPSTVCWQFGNSKKVCDITILICKNIYKEQNVLDLFIHSTNIYWEHFLLYPLKYVKHWKLNVATDRRVESSWKAGLICRCPALLFISFFLVLHRQLPPGGNMSLLSLRRGIRNIPACKEYTLSL